MEAAAARNQIVSFLAAHNVLTLATEREGKPWAASLFYASEGLVLYFLSDPGTRHVQNLTANPRVSVTVHEEYRNWSDIQGVQLEGACELVASPAESARAMAVYASKFPFLRDAVSHPRELGSALAKAKWYRINPHWARLVDNTRGFGWKVVLTPGAKEI